MPGKGRITVILAFVLLSTAAIMYITGFGQDPQVQVKGSAGGIMKLVPSRLGELSLTGPVVTGEEAKSQLDRLHGTGIAIDDGFIASYGGGIQQAILWVSLSGTEGEAFQLLDIMDAKMPASRVFTGRRELRINGRPVFFVVGAGMDNYYWQQGKMVVWLGLINISDAARQEGLVRLTMQELQR